MLPYVCGICSWRFILTHWSISVLLLCCFNYNSLLISKITRLFSSLYSAQKFKRKLIKFHENNLKIILNQIFIKIDILTWTEITFLWWVFLPWIWYSSPLFRSLTSFKNFYIFSIENIKRFYYKILISKLQKTSVNKILWSEHPCNH